MIITSLLVILILSIMGLFWYLSANQSHGTVFSDSFEAGMKNWERLYDLPDDPNNPPQKVKWSIADSTERARTGGRSLKMYIDGRQDDGTVWVLRSLPSNAGENVTVNLEICSYSENENFNTRSVIVASISDTIPKSEVDFEVLGPADNWVGWKTFTYSVTLMPDDDHVWVAFGTSVRWETEVTQFFDDVQIEIK